MSKTAVVIVTHNSEKVLGPCLEALAEQSAPAAFICLVDSGSSDVRYLETYEGKNDIYVLRQENNIGFSRANNLGYGQIPNDVEYVLFLNPDVLLDPPFLEQAERRMVNNQTLGIVTGRMLGYDFDMLKATSRLDSTGIFRRWYGRWYDRGQGEVNRGRYKEAEDIPASCGALMFCRKAALKQAVLAENVIFDPDFFLYKEDIELSFRVRKSGWSIRYEPDLVAFHGRGWQKDRPNMSRELRIMAARNEILLYRKHPSPYILWALAKYFLVATFNV